MDLGLKGKVALITGASQGLGWAMARRLADEGMAIAVAARTADKLQTLAREIEKGGGQCLAFPADLRRPEAPGEFAAAAEKHFGRIDLVVNNAGATARGDFIQLTEEQWQDGFALKFFGAMRLCRAAWPSLAAHRGSIVNIAGVGGRTGSADFTIGGPVNAALLNLTKCLADRGMKDGVRVNALNPGYIQTDRLIRRIEHLAAERKIPLEQAKKLIAEEAGLSRFGEPDEIASAVAFLASERASYIQGAIFDVDGGLTRTL
jgi:NAD(P)-dependent dehydrogenase (short-subunit alcohol dehydrogenase family)